MAKCYAFVPACGRKVRRRLLQIGGVDDGAYKAVLMQGSGTFAVESVVSSIIPRNGKLLVAINGAYGRRVAQIATRLGIETDIFPDDVRALLSALQTSLEEMGIWASQSAAN